MQLATHPPLTAIEHRATGEVFSVPQNATTEQLLGRFRDVTERKPKIAAEVLSVTCAILMHRL